jgi:dihydropteroate synthase
MVAEGVDILDIGGESTRPGATHLSLEEESSRVLPVLKAVREAVTVPISIDSYHAETVRAALAAGANWINDIWGLRRDDEMKHVVVEADCPVVLMHNGRHRPRLIDIDPYYGHTHYDDLLPDVLAELQQIIDLALTHGVKKENIIIDPGIGFGKNAEQNIEILRNLQEFKKLGYPLLLGTSRKGFIGRYLGDLPPDDRVEGTAATVAWGIAQGVDIVRVHDVKAMVRVARMTDVIVRG